MASDYKRKLLLRRRQFLSTLPFVTVFKPSLYAYLQVGSSGNLGMEEFPSSQSLLTPNAEFFVRNHFEPAILGASTWKLGLTGAVRNPIEITYRDLVGLPSRTLTVTLECAGNPVGGGMVGTATWTGIPLCKLLEKADLVPGVSIIRLVGADQRTPPDDPSLPVTEFMRSIPLAKALHPDTLLAYQMNGVPLPAEHGYPLRAIVPGWYGMDSVKWLVEVMALKHEDTNYYLTAEYVRARLGVTGADWQPVTRMQIKSQIVKPEYGEVVPLGPYQIMGTAWAGDRDVATVEVSTDAAKNWGTADLNTKAKPYTWVLWSYRWVPKAQGRYTILVRATDSESHKQPPAADLLRLDDYEQNWYQAIQCGVR